MVLATLASSYFRQPRGWCANDREAALNLLKGCVWPGIYNLFLWSGNFSIHFDIES
jgi:hypothetical protein